MLDGLVVDEQRMRRNLDMTSGLIVAEAVMMSLAPHLGRNEAHDLVYAACRTVNEKGGTLAGVLAGMPEVSSRLDRQAIERLTDPTNYLGAAPQMVDRVISNRR
jgi:3-carboxy-cis,cis-muconate cycloisomerase